LPKDQDDVPAADERLPFDGARATMLGDLCHPLLLAAERAERVEVGRTGGSSCDREEHVVIDRGRTAKTEPVSRAPDHLARRDVERREGGVAAREIDEAAGPTKPQRSARAPTETPARLAAREIDRDEVPFAFRDDEQSRQRGRVHDEPGRRSANA